MAEDVRARPEQLAKRCKTLERCWLVCLVILGFLAFIWRGLWFNWSPIAVYSIGIGAGGGFLCFLTLWYQLRRRLNQDGTTAD